ncbi:MULTISPECIES: DNA-3-methyladenine glycosylase [unclassified Afipia]|uniref:DNA-3-methyladenine glycosylase n=1 Tax=unclassified Afipia TaxID=2642050 RepID=UPI000467BD57|nr:MULTISPECIES: DNA-3-methyladenine glycosylase [unclassified Afipia]MAH71624.1 DNA-3-methyladenine glycosylase [Afipia sp.]OUX59455.1 MAG: DNA-3-methyladenine glycosylase [Afipia sp. TMED4]HAO40446.1 DNA-3-methyladenine glycosylase [Afipia sp.]HAP49587.1 DNA-3-methyladenine glycosylase [Afipia sp.]HAQ94706.1 DNA-3-methyladenine glycosylase [Afipia sp.]
MADLQSQAPVGRLLTRKFFARSVHDVASDLIGATLLVDGVGGIIVEVEAYHHTEPAAHSFNGPTPRNMVMFGPPGFLYVYRSYGIHWCMNFVCEKEGSASAVLVRAIEPTHGIPAMRRRRGLHDERMLSSGPGKLCEAMAVTGKHNGLALDTPPIAIYARTRKPEIVSGIRIGITKAVELPWRYGLKGSKFMSQPFPA